MILLFIARISRTARRSHSFQYSPIHHPAIIAAPKKTIGNSGNMVICRDRRTDILLKYNGNHAHAGDEFRKTHKYKLSRQNQPTPTPPPTMAHMESEVLTELVEIPQALARAVQVALSNTVNLYVFKHLRDPAMRGLYVTSAVLAICLRSSTIDAKSTKRSASLTIARDIAIYVLINVISSDVIPVGPNSTPLATAIVLMLITLIPTVSDAMCHGGDSQEILSAISSNCKYVCAHTLAIYMMMSRTPMTSTVIALTFSLVERALVPFVGEPVFHEVIIMATISVIKNIILIHIPPALAIPTQVLIVSFAHPLIGSKIIGVQTIYQFIIYQAGDAVAHSFSACFGTLVASLMANTLALLAPTVAIQTLFQVTTVVLATNLAGQTLGPAAQADPLFAFIIGSLAIHLVVSIVLKSK